MLAYVYSIQNTMIWRTKFKIAINSRIFFFLSIQGLLSYVKYRITIELKYNVFRILFLIYFFLIFQVSQRAR